MKWGKRWKKINKNKMLLIIFQNKIKDTKQEIIRKWREEKCVRNIKWLHDTEKGIFVEVTVCGRIM